ncbi:MAG: preprotein translocase subunit SecE [Legionellaceae bacterium]|nr:preprotein translocase subunit SecE [Legionellaceae bacterium]
MKISNLKLVEVAAWLGVVVVTIASFLGTYLGNLSGPIISMIWIGWVVATFTLFYFTEKGKQCYAFTKDAKLELEKVVWPSRQETTQTTFIVMIMVTVTGFVLWGIDSGMMWTIGKITQLG